MLENRVAELERRMERMRARMGWLTKWMAGIALDFADLRRGGYSGRENPPVDARPPRASGVPSPELQKDVHTSRETEIGNSLRRQWAQIEATLRRLEALAERQAGLNAALVEEIRHLVTVSERR